MDSLPQVEIERVLNTSLESGRLVDESQLVAGVYEHWIKVVNKHPKKDRIKYFAYENIRSSLEDDFQESQVLEVLAKILNYTDNALEKLSRLLCTNILLLQPFHGGDLSVIHYESASDIYVCIYTQYSQYCFLSISQAPKVFYPTTNLPMNGIINKCGCIVPRLERQCPNCNKLVYNQ